MNKFGNMMCPEVMEELAIFCKAMSHPTRLWILQFLTQQDCCYSGEIADELPIARSTVSEHLRQLKEAGLIQGEIEHPRIRYCINPHTWERARSLLGEMFRMKVEQQPKIKQCNSKTIKT
jgi:ArsR family transcriptional regulator, arsenate/arsenite/antimonite-responsive transcriptional repressor